MKAIIVRNKKTVILLGIVMLASFLACGYFGTKMILRVRLRHAAMTAYENGDYASAERLLLQYVKKNPEAEDGFVTLANIYHEFGNVDMEAQMWQMASSLSPQNAEYRERMLDIAIKSANYALLHGILGRKAKVDEAFTDRELYLIVISSYRSGYPKDGDDVYRKYVEMDPEAFHKNELGRMAEFMATYESWTEGERDGFLNGCMRSEDPVIRFEALYFAIRRLEQRGGNDPENDAVLERLLKQAAEANYYAGTAMLADFYFTRYRFSEVIEILEPYLKTIDDMNLYPQLAESYAFTGNLGKLKALEKILRKKNGFMPLLADYCEILIAYLENDKQKLAIAVRKSGKRVDSPLSRFIRLRVAMSNGSFDEIRDVAQEFFSNPPFRDLHSRALFVCMNYLEDEMKKPEHWNDPSQMAGLARILSVYLRENSLLTELILLDQYKKGLVKEEDLLSALTRFPDDEMLLRITAEFLIFHGKAKDALPIVERLSDIEKTMEQPDPEIRILFMLALDQVGRHDEAADVFQELVEQSEFEPDLLAQYFQFCLNNRRTEDLESMGERLTASKNEKAQQFGLFFRAASLLLAEDKSGEKEALDLLASAPAVSPDFTFYAANRLYQHGRLEEAEAKYTAILKTYRTPSLPYVNLSGIYHEKGETRKAMEAAKTAFELEKESLLPAFVYAKRLSEANRYEEAVSVLNFPRYAVNYRKDIVDLWRDCMHHVIEKSIAGRKYLQAESQCKHLLLIVPDDEFGKEQLERVQEILFPKNR